MFDEFTEVLKTLFLQNTFRQLRLVYGKKITNRIVKSPPRKGKIWKQLGRKTMTHGKQKLNHYLHQDFISF